MNTFPCLRTSLAAFLLTGLASHAASPGSEAPVTLPSLGYLKPAGEEQCQWMRQPLPSGEPTVVFRFDGSCEGAKLSWSPDGKQGLVFVRGHKRVPRAWRVDFDARTGKLLELKTLPGGTNAPGADRPFIDQLGFDRQGRIVALIADIYSSRKLGRGKGGKRFISFEGQSYPVGPEDGVSTPSLALAYRLEADQWQRFEVKASSSSMGSGTGVDALAVAKELTPVISTSLPDKTVGKEASKDAVKRLRAAFPHRSPENGWWVAVAIPGGTLHAWSSLMDGTPALFAPVRLEQNGKLMELEGFSAPEEDALAAQVEGDLLLIIHFGDTMTTQIWNTRTRKRVASFKDVEAAGLWPSPAVR